jgi:6-pyruvoyltetrahydropterin/6-carboxytetrahydropterin synthase
MSHGSLSLHLFKQNFKFSSAHFLIFDANHAEMLHGHNYQVQVDLFTSQALETTKVGYLIDFGVIKKAVKALVDQWDEHVLLPGLNPEMHISDLNETTYQVLFRDRYYAFPKKEVVVLPISNTSVELLAECLSKHLEPFMMQFPVQFYHTRVDETPGQGATYIRYLSK